MHPLLPALILPALLALPAVHAEEAPPSHVQHGLRLPTGFEATLVADDRLAPDIHCMTLSPSGEMVVSGRGYLRLLKDDNSDGVADRALDFAAAPKDGAMGLFWDGDDLYCVGDGGLRVYRNAGGAGRMRPSELLFRCRTGSEHTAHAVRRGPDGWLYLLVGDQTRIGREHITSPTSPVRDPVGGCLLRFSPDFRVCEVVADGLRNAYGMDYNRQGEWFTFDSDNERCVSLPWYAPTRCCHLLPGSRHGWLAARIAATWRIPPEAIDVVAPVVALGRGSPTGVVCYRHAQFPARYRGGLFLLDWTFGQVHFVALSRQGSTYHGRPEVFLRSVGDNGFAPTAAAVHPKTGDLYLAIGGRGTRGAVYRIRHPAGLKALQAKDVAAQAPVRRTLEWQPDRRAALLREAVGRDDHACRRALEEIHRHRARFRSEEIEPILRATAGRSDCGIRQGAARLLASLEDKERERIAKLLVSPLQRTTRYLAWPSSEAFDLVGDRALPVEVRRDGARLVQLWMGDVLASAVRGTVWEGYTRRAAAPAIEGRQRAVLRSAFPSGDGVLDRELTRCLAMVEDDDPKTLQRVSAFLTVESDPRDDFHHLIVLARLKGNRSIGITRTVATALLDLDRKMVERKRNRESNWYLRLAELHAGLAARDPALNRTLLGHPAFGRPDHVLFTRCPGFARTAAAMRFLTRASREPDFRWNAEMVGLVGELPVATALPVLRRLWGEQGLDEAILAVLARSPQPADRTRFFTGLMSGRLATLTASVNALDRLALPGDDKETRDEAFALLRAGRLLGSGKEEEPLRARIVARLGRLAGRKMTGPEAAWTWFRGRWPDLATRLDASDGVDVAGWHRRLARIDWAKGDARRGANVAIKASCAGCHSGAAALGPDLRGVTGRFSRDDLFTAIVQPSKDVSPRYRTTQLTTARGQVYQGIIIYEATDSVLMLTGPGQTVRLTHAQIESRRLTTTSLMPVGLLDRLSDADIADLYAHLRSLGR